ncbi:MAG: hypothetical protein WDO24_30980 [Pseudomonadota bacterium]
MILIIVLVTLIVLSEIGVDIGPLLAGAGVVGLAIGFGAQTLVKDVITGLFILIEDTINVGRRGPGRPAHGCGRVDLDPLDPDPRRRGRRPHRAVQRGQHGQEPDQGLQLLRVRHRGRAIGRSRRGRRAAAPGSMPRSAPSPRFEADILEPLDIQGIDKLVDGRHGDARADPDDAGRAVAGRARVQSADRPRRSPPPACRRRYRGTRSR